MNISVCIYEAIYSYTYVCVCVCVCVCTDAKPYSPPYEDTCKEV